MTKSVGRLTSVTILLLHTATSFAARPTAASASCPMPGFKPPPGIVPEWRARPTPSVPMLADVRHFPAK